MKTSRRGSAVLVAAVLAGLVALSGCASTGPAGHAVTTFTAEDYKALGIERGSIAQREDGMRTSGKSGSYEWWYFDCALEDGSTLVVVFYTKNMINPAGPLAPLISVNLDRPDGTRFMRTYSFPAKDFSASREGCDLRIGANRVTGNLSTYTIHLELEDVKADLSLVGTVPSWRPETGVSMFRRGGEEHFFAWLPSVPQGRVSGNLEAGGRSGAVSGSGYHDHNWGDVPMTSLIHDWYWGRAQVGPYTVITAWITAADAYSGDVMPVFMLAKDGKIIADDGSKARLRAGEVSTNPKTGKPVADSLVYEYGTAGGGGKGYRVTFERKADLVATPFAVMMGPVGGFFARLAGFDGAYHRFTGPVRVEELLDGKVTESATEESAVWELMYFGHAPEASK